MQRVSKGIAQEEERIRGLMAMPHSIAQAYRKWETSAYEQLNSFESNDLKTQMTILNYDGKSSENFIQTGEELIQNLKKYQSSLTEKTNNAFTSFTL
jgi:hypothetical protein